MCYWVYCICRIVRISCGLSLGQTFFRSSMWISSVAGNSKYSKRIFGTHLSQFLLVGTLPAVITSIVKLTQRTSYFDCNKINQFTSRGIKPYLDLLHLQSESTSNFLNMHNPFRVWGDFNRISSSARLYLWFSQVLKLHDNNFSASTQIFNFVHDKNRIANFVGDEYLY